MQELPIDRERGCDIAFHFDGRRIIARQGESVAAALWRAGIRALRASPVERAPRGVFCAVGICQECVVVIDGLRQASCVTVVKPGLQVFSVSDPATESQS